MPACLALQSLKALTEDPKSKLVSKRSMWVTSGLDEALTLNKVLE